MSDKPDGSGSVTNEKDLGNQKYVLSVPPGEPTEPQQADGRLAQLRAFAVKKLQDDQVSRRAGAVFTGLAGMVVIIVCLFWSISSLPDFRDGINKVQNVSQERLVWAVIAGHAVITIAWVFFGYQLLRMAERFALPLNHAHRARHLLGINSPFQSINAVLRQAAKVAELVRTINEPRSPDDSK